MFVEGSTGFYTLKVVERKAQGKQAFIKIQKSEMDIL